MAMAFAEQVVENAARECLPDHDVAVASKR
jgi:hypothetical protein